MAPRIYLEDVAQNEAIDNINELWEKFPVSKTTHTIEMSQSSFNLGIPTYMIPKEELEVMEKLQKQMARLGFELSAFQSRVDSIISGSKVSQSDIKNIVKELHDAACILFLHWSYSHMKKERTNEYATARLFNRVTAATRKLNIAFSIFSKEYLSELHKAIKNEMIIEAQAKKLGKVQRYDPSKLA
ncbi:MAG: hypothetical protein ACHQX1_03075, partial [Candidatus Micrarchaeales archaeon]